ncbi:MAG: hypothetical protein IIB54_15130, partial [Planctomycetes bacterium]|nr:hypothetical protein [Planctomycetota bacterium]
DDDDDDDDDDDEGSDNLATALPSDPEPIEDDVRPEPFALRPLERLGIYLRSLRSSELLSTVEGIEMFDDAPRKTIRSSQEHKIAVNRLRRASVLAVLKRFDSLVFKQLIDVQTGEMELIDQSEQIRATLTGVWVAYAGQSKGEPDPAGFRVFLSEDPRYADALAYIEGLQSLFREMWIMGLTPREMRLSLNTILGTLMPTSIRPAQLEDLLDLGFLG